MGVMKGLRATATAGLLSMALSSVLAQNWVLTSAPVTNWTSIAMSADGTRCFASAFGFSSFSGGWAGPLLVSTNSGTTWSYVPPTNPPFLLYQNWQAVACSSDGAKLFAVGQPPGDVIFPTPIYFSTNAGGHWTNTSALTGVWESMSASADATKLTAGSQYGNGHRLYISTDSGNTWALTPVTNAHLGAWSADGQMLVVCGSGGSTLATSTNQGGTWSYAPFTNVYWTSVTASTDGTKLAAATYGTLGRGFISVSTNSGMTWHTVNAPSNAWYALASSANGTKLVAASWNGPIYTSADSGVTWISNNAPKLKWMSVAASADGNTLAAVAIDGGIYISQTTPAPALAITPGGNDLLISWIVPSMPFVLQENGDLNTAAWMTVAAGPVLNLTNLRHEVTVPLSGTNRFYRLRSL